MALPFAPFAPGQVSPAPPPVAKQLVALTELHFNVTDWPAVNDAGEAVRDTDTTGQVTTTDVWFD